MDRICSRFLQKTLKVALFVPLDSFSSEPKVLELVGLALCVMFLFVVVNRLTGDLKVMEPVRL